MELPASSFGLHIPSFYGGHYTFAPPSDNRKQCALKITFFYFSKKLSNY